MRSPLVPLLILVGTLCLGTAASAQRPVKLKPGRARYELGRRVEVLEDSERAWSIEQVSSERFDKRFKRSKQEVPNFGFSTSAYWFRFALKNPTSERLSYILELAYPMVDRVELYERGPDKSGKEVWRAPRLMGDSFVDGNKEISHQHFIFPLAVRGNETKPIYIRVVTEGSVQVPLVLWTNEAFLSVDHRRQIGHGVYYGLLFVNVLFNLFLLFVIKDRSYLLYVLFVLSAVGYQGSFDGLAQEWLWPDQPWWGNMAVPFFICSTILLAILFAKDFLSLKERFARWDRAMTWIAGAAGIGMAGSLFLPYRVIILYATAATVGACAALLALAVAAWRSKYPPARYYLAAWSAFYLGILVMAMNKMGALPVTAFTENAHKYGFAIKALLLTMALADRINLMREEKERAQAQALELQRKTAEDLEQEVEAKTHDLQVRTDEAERAKEQAERSKEEAEQSKEEAERAREKEAQARKELERAYDQLAELDRLKSRFFANVSHELRTPLTLILTPLERLLHKEGKRLTPEVLEKLQGIQGNTHRLLRLVNQLLELSRLESGVSRITYELHDVRKLVEPIVKVFEPLARSKGLSLHLRGPERLPEVYVSPGKLDEVLGNLLSNACKFTDPGGTVVVRLRSDEGSVRIVVKDTGIGIAEENLLKIFQRFGQVDSSESRRHEGTGIGLALVKELIELMSWQLEVESDLGVGSIFRLVIPRGTDHIVDPSLISDEPDTGADWSVGTRRAAAALAAEVRSTDQDARAAEAPEEAGDAAPTAAAGELEAAPAVEHDEAEQKVIVAPPAESDAREEGEAVAEPAPAVEAAVDDEAELPEPEPDQPSAIDGDDTRVEGLSPVEEEGAEPGEQRPLVVVVEDNAEMRALVVELCTEEGFHVAEAENGKQGLEQVTKHRPSLVISDVMMPEMGGHEMLRRIREDPVVAFTPVMLLTAKAGPDLRVRGLESGADDYVVKPFDPREFKARARNLVRMQQQERKLREMTTSLQHEVVKQASALERARMLSRYLPPGVVRSVIEEGQQVKVQQERRRLTVFCLELRGFDQLIEATDPEDMAAMLNSYLSAMTEVAFSHGATVDRFVRDTVVGYFGAPISQGPEQDAVGCAKMALEMWQRAVEICERWEELISGEAPVPTMIVTSGRATVGNFGSADRLDYTAVGGPMDEARALLEALSPGVVACSQTTWNLIKRAVEGEFLQEASIRFRSTPMNLFWLAGATVDAEQQATMDSGPRPRAGPPTPGPVEPGPAEADKQPGSPDEAKDKDKDKDKERDEQEEPDRKAASPRPAAAAVDLRPGTVILDRFDIIGRIGSGGMGTVYMARDLKLAQDVALKLVRPDRKAEPSVLESLYREVKLARLISHPNVARIYDLGEWEGHEFISMEYIDGLSLAERLKSDGMLPIDFGVRVMRQLCDGLAAAHAAGVVHRDLKPANIMLQQGGRVVILDFGIAKWASVLHQTAEKSAQPKGTPHYMAPEQFMGGTVDGRTDIYALGVVAFEIFTGSRPFQAVNPYTLAWKHSKTTPPDPMELRPDLPPRLAAVILRCMEKAPQDRFDTAQEIVSLLRFE